MIGLSFLYNIRKGAEELLLEHFGDCAQQQLVRLYLA
jgi:hypothetical protein